MWPSFGTSEEKNDCNLLTTLEKPRVCFREVCQRIAIKTNTLAFYYSSEKSLFSRPPSQLVTKHKYSPFA